MVERGVRFVQIYHNNWDTHAQRRRPPARSVPRRRSAVLRADSRPEAARHARRHADHLGRRIRPHDLLARRPLGAELRPRSSPALLHDVDGRRRLQGRHASTARPTTSRTTSSKIPSTSATSTRRCSISLGFDHERFTLQAPGPRSEAHGRASRPRGPRGVIVKRSPCSAIHCGRTLSARCCRLELHGGVSPRSVRSRFATMRNHVLGFLLAASLLLSNSSPCRAATPSVARPEIAATQTDTKLPPSALPLRFVKHEHIALVGNSLAERMNLFGNFEALLHSRFPQLELVSPQLRAAMRCGGCSPAPQQLHNDR